MDIIAKTQQAVADAVAAAKRVQTAIDEGSGQNDGNPDLPPDWPVSTADYDESYGTRLIPGGQPFTTTTQSGHFFQDRKRDLNLVYDSDRWEKMPFVFQLGRTFKTYEDLLAYAVNGMDNVDGTIVANPSTDKAHASMNEIVQAITPEKYMRLNCADTSLGGNDAINCYPQFCEDDDIVHLMTASQTIRGVNGEDIIVSGMGRVYMETYDTYQKILWVSVGVIKFSNLLRFYQTAVDKDMADLLHGTGSKAARTLGAALVNVALLPLQIMTMPIRYLYKVGRMLEYDPVTRYYDFWSDMVLYFKYVNSIIQHVSINLGLYPSADSSEEATAVTGASVTTARTVVEQSAAEARNSTSFDSNTSNIPDFYRNGIDIFSIMSKRSTYENNMHNRENARVVSDEHLRTFNTDHYFNKLAGSGWDSKEVKDSDGDGGIFSGAGNFFSDLMTNAWNSAYGSDKYLGFRIEKSTDSSESLSNSTGESSIAQTINSAAQSSRDALFGVGMTGDASEDYNKFTGAISGVGSFVKGAVDSVTDFFTGGASTTITRTLMSGAARIDIPEVWTGSSFSKSYSFDMTLRDPFGGNPISYVSRIIVPLACVLAMGLPRTAGENSYGSPFYIRAFCKGMFSVPLGMVESISISRGAPEYGWSVYGLPTVVRLSFTIKDLGTVMHMAMAPSGTGITDALRNSFGANSTFQEYMMTLAGLGIKERTLVFERLSRNFRLWQRLTKSTWGNSNYLGMLLGHTFPFQIGGAISKFSGLPNN